MPSITASTLPRAPERRVELSVKECRPATGAFVFASPRHVNQQRPRISSIAGALAAHAQEPGEIIIGAFARLLYIEETGR